MATNVEKSAEKFTEIDLELAGIYYSILVERCMNGNFENITYGDLLNTAKNRHQNNEAVKGSIEVYVGHRLRVVRHFMSSRNLPDLSCLVVQKKTGRNSKEYLSKFDTEYEHQRVIETNWNEVTSDFNAFLAATKVAIARKPLTREKAEVELIDFYMLNKNRIVNNVVNYKESIIKSLMDGISSEEAFEKYLIEDL